MRFPTLGQYRKRVTVSRDGAPVHSNLPAEVIVLEPEIAEFGVVRQPTQNLAIALLSQPEVHIDDIITYSGQKNRAVIVVTDTQRLPRGMKVFCVQKGLLLSTGGIFTEQFTAEFA